MTESMAEMVRRDVECEDLLVCLYGLNPVDGKAYQVLAGEEDALTVDELAERIDRERSTAYRSTRRLLEAGLVRKEQVNYDRGGYYHVYYPADPEGTADEMQRLLNDWYAQVGQLIREFRNEYGDAAVGSAPEN